MMEFLLNDPIKGLNRACDMNVHSNLGMHDLVTLRYVVISFHLPKFFFVFCFNIRPGWKPLEQELVSHYLFILVLKTQNLVSAQ